MMSSLYGYHNKSNKLWVIASKYGCYRRHLLFRNELHRFQSSNVLTKAVT